jgi:hypothetical protein
VHNCSDDLRQSKLFRFQEDVFFVFCEYTKVLGAFYCSRCPETHLKYKLELTRAYCPHSPSGLAPLSCISHTWPEDIVRWCLTDCSWQINTAIKVLDGDPPIRDNPRDYYNLDVQGLEVRNNRVGNLFARFHYCIQLIQVSKSGFLSILAPKEPVGDRSL